MAEHVNWFTVLLNKWFGKAALALLTALHIHPNNPDLPIPNQVAMTLIVCLISGLFFLWLRTRISVDRPGATQQVMECLITNSMRVGISDLLEDNVGHGFEQYIPFVGSISIFILFSNLSGIIPALNSPTGEKTVPLACAVLTFIYYNWAGFRALGAGGYMKTFAGPVPQLSFLIFPVELISNAARLLSLTVRLWANIFASELIYFIFLGLTMIPSIYLAESHPALSIALGVFPGIFPVIFIGLHAFVAIIQAFVFTILPAIYIGLATAEEH
jgi:F-type H+-transporting ATPase subunit a